MTELLEEPQFKVLACIRNYRETRGQPTLAVTTEKSRAYLAHFLTTSDKGVPILEDKLGSPIRARKIEELSKRIKRNLASPEGNTLYLCQTGSFGIIKTRTIRSYDLEQTNSQLSHL